MLFRLFTVLAVIALGVSTWILSSPGHRPKAATGTGGADLPGYYLKGASLTDFDLTGKPSIHLEAERIDQVDHGSDVMLSNVRVHYQAPNGQLWLLVSDSAVVQSGGNVIDMSGNVRLDGAGSGRAGTVVVHTDTLRYDVPETTVTTKSDVRIDFGLHVLTARGLAANLKERTMRLESRVNGRFQH
jgi:LPS export ABC transporter protein LptC